MKISIAFALLFGLTGAVRAGEWKELDSKDSLIALGVEWPWVTPERGEYLERWSDGKSVHTFIVAWSTPEYRLEIAVYRLAPGYYWNRINKLDKAQLAGWNYLGDKEMGELTKLDCVFRECVRVTVDRQTCIGFKDVKGSAGKRWYSDAGTNIVEGYFCSVDDFAADHVDEALRSLEIRTADTGSELVGPDVRSGDKSDSRGTKFPRGAINTY